MAIRRHGLRAGLAAELAVLRRRPVDWFLLSGSRLAVSAGLLLVVAGTVWGLVGSGLAPLVERTPVLFLLFALISGNVTLLSVVVSISQFVLARHLETPGEIREQMREVVGYRQEVVEVTRERVLPVTPAGFFLLLFRSIDRDVRELRGRERPDAEAALGREVEALAASLGDHAGEVVELLERDGGGLTHALLAVLDANYSRYFHETYRLRARYGDELPASAAEDLTRLERQLEQVDVARRYFKTVFIQSELAALSRLLLYIGLPVLVATVGLTLLFTATGGPYVSPAALSVTIPLVVTAGFAPIVLLAAYILRLATVVRRTAAMYPFTTRYAG